MKLGPSPVLSAYTPVAAAMMGSRAGRSWFGWSGPKAGKDTYTKPGLISKLRLAEKPREPRVPDTKSSISTSADAINFSIASAVAALVEASDNGMACWVVFGKGFR